MGDRWFGDDDNDFLDIEVPPLEMYDIFAPLPDEQPEPAPEPEPEPEPEEVHVPPRRICAARQVLFIMFRRRVWRYQHNAGIIGGVFPENLVIPEPPEPVKQRLLDMFARKNRISPTRCIRISRTTGLQPIEVCDFFLHLNYPTLQADLARRRRRRRTRRPRTFVYNLFVNFKVEVVNIHIHFRQPHRPNHVLEVPIHNR